MGIFTLQLKKNKHISRAIKHFSNLNFPVKKTKKLDKKFSPDNKLPEEEQECTK